MRGILNLLITFLIILIVFNYQHYYIKKSMKNFNDKLNTIGDISNNYDMQNIEELYSKAKDVVGSKEEYYILYDDHILSDEDILDEKIAMMNFEKIGIDSLAEVKIESIINTDYCLLNDSTIITKDKAKKRNLTNKAEYEFYVGQSNKYLIIIAARPGISTGKLESGRFVISGIKQALDDDIFKDIKKNGKDIYSTDYIWINNVYIFLEE